MTSEKRIIFFISDSTGITVDKLGRSLLSQFGSVEFQSVSLRYVNSIERAQQAAKQIAAAGDSLGQQPIVLSSLLDARLREEIKKSAGLYIDMFEIMINPLEQALGQAASGLLGQAHMRGDVDHYHTRIDAVNFSLRYDDGLGDGNYDNADVVLVGVSRTGKTPTCLYLALEYGVFAANYPLTEDDMKHDGLPQALQRNRDKLFGLTIEPQRLQEIRRQRHIGEIYATLDNCRRQVTWAEELFRVHRIPVLDTTTISIEEIATRILSEIHQAE